MDALRLVQRLFHLEDMRVEVELQLLVTEVNTQLLERVDLRGDNKPGKEKKR